MTGTSNDGHLVFPEPALSEPHAVMLDWLEGHLQGRNKSKKTAA